MANASTVMKTEAAGVAIQQVFGFKPELRYYENSSEIIFTPQQQTIIQNWLLKQMEKKEAPEIKINLSPILIPVLIRKSFPYLAGIFGGGVVIGKKLK